MAQIPVKHIIIIFNDSTTRSQAGAWERVVGLRVVLVEVQPPCQGLMPGAVRSGGLPLEAFPSLLYSSFMRR